jgi:hypothetical protein
MGTVKRHNPKKTMARLMPRGALPKALDNFAQKKAALQQSIE